MHGTPISGAFDDFFTVERPEGMSVRMAVRQGGNGRVLLRHKRTGARLRGSFAPTADGSGHVFLGTVWVSDPNELTGLRLGLEHFAAHDPVVDFVQMLQAHRNATADLKTMMDRLQRQRKSLQESNERLALLSLFASKTEDAVFITDSQWRIEWANDGFERLSGFSVEEVLGKTPREVLHGPGTDPEVVKTILNHVANGRPYRTVMRHYRKDGSAFLSELEVQPVLGNDGRPAHFVSVERDVTVRHAAEERIRLREAILAALAGVSRDMFTSLDWRSSLSKHLPDLGTAVLADGAFAVSLQNRWGQSIGILETEWVRKDFPGRYRQRDLNWTEAGRDPWEAALRRGEPVHANRTNGGRASEQIAVSSLLMVPVFLHGVLWGALGFYQTETERVWSAAEVEALETVAAVLGSAMERSARSRSLSQAKAKLGSALEGGGLASYVIDPERRWIELDERVADVLGHRGLRGTVGIDEFDEWVHDEDLFTFRLALAELLSGNSDRMCCTVRIQRHDGTYRWIRISARANREEYLDLGGTVYGTFQEVHDQVLNEMRLRQTIGELHDARQKTTEAAATVQRELLIKSPPARLGAFNVRAFSISAKGAGGDFFDFFQIGDHAVDVLVGDVMGKGLTAALIGAGFKAQIARTLGLLATAGEHPSAARVMQAVHDRVGNQLRELECFATLAYARIDTVRGKIELIDCGHTRSVIWSRRTGEARFISGENMPIGIIPGEYYRPSENDIEPGDLVILYSDGVTDHTIEGLPLDEKRLAMEIAEAANASPGEPWVAVERRLRELAESAPLADDFTVAIVAVPTVRLDACSGKRQVDSSVDSIDEVRQFVMDAMAGSEHDWDPGDGFMIEIGAVEAFTNIVRHAHTVRPGETIEMQWEDQTDGLEFRFAYAGEPFEVREADGSDEPRMAEGGYGLDLIHRTMDRTEYYQDDRGTMWITMWKASKAVNPDE